MAEIDGSDSSSTDKSIVPPAGTGLRSGPPESEGFWRQNVGKGVVGLSIAIALGRGLIKLANHRDRPAAPPPFLQQGDPAVNMQELLRKIVPVDPEVEAAIAAATEAITQNPNDAAPYRARGSAQLRKQEYDLALADFTEAIRLDGSNGEAFLGRGLTWGQTGHLDKALVDLEEAIRLDTDNPRPLAARAELWSLRREYQRAIADFQAAIEVDPQDGSAHNGLAWLYATCPDANFRDGTKGVEHATKACQITDMKQPHWIAALAAAHAENGDFDQANKYQFVAHELYSPIDKAHWGHLRRLYREGKPWRESATRPPSNP